VELMTYDVRERRLLPSSHRLTFLRATRTSPISAVAETQSECSVRRGYKRQPARGGGQPRKQGVTMEAKSCASPAVTVRVRANTRPRGVAGFREVHCPLVRAVVFAGVCRSCTKVVGCRNRH
jgi:hypothetical protein